MERAATYAALLSGGCMPAEKYKTKNCNVLSYNKKTKELDVNFSGYGIRLYNISEINENYVKVRYRGEIGTPNFVYKL